MKNDVKPRPPLPTFTEETARKKVQAAEDAWNSRDPERVSLAYTEDTLPVRTARGEEAVCLDPAADCFYRSTNHATSCQHDSTGRFPARVFESLLCTGRRLIAAAESVRGAIGRSQGAAHGLCGNLQFASPRCAADAGGSAARQWSRHSPVSGESHHRGHDTERRP